MRLDAEALGILRHVDRFTYDREAQKAGIVHFGIGAFHRAHQAWYTDLAMERGERDWAIVGVSLRSAAVMAQLNPQGGLYSLTERGPEGETTRIIGAVREVLVADRHRRAIVDRIASSACRIVSFTVTEKGYCRAADGSLDFAAAQAGFYPLLADGLERRRAEGLPGLTLLSCDNLADNGRQLERLIGEYLARERPAMAAWFAAECTCPSTMVDRIVPATTEADLASLAGRLGGFEDRGAVFTEPFSQWVIEDRFAGPRPRWEDHGAQIVPDVAPYETAKLRMLNGAHSLLAYCGLGAGHSFVHEAVADPELRALVTRLTMDEAAPTIAAAPGQDLAAYAESLLTRFANPAVRHRLAQIAMDGSQKIPQRWLPVLAIREAQGNECPGIRRGLAAWFEHLRRGQEVDDPCADELRAILATTADDDALDAIFGADWRATAAG